MLIRTVTLVGLAVVLLMGSACLPVADGSKPSPGSNQRPIALADEDVVVDGGTVVTLDGSRSNDPDGDAIVYQWTQVAGPNVVLVDSGTSKASFTAPDEMADMVLTFQLVVQDSNGQRASTNVRVTVRSTSSIQPPLEAVAGANQFVASGSLVSMDGAHRGGEGDVTYQWSQHPVTGGPPVVLSSASDPKATYTAPTVTEDNALMVWILTVTDEELNTDTAEVTIVVAPPLDADAGEDQVVFEGESVTLGATSTGGVGDIAFLWTQTAGPAVTTTEADTATPTFQAPDDLDVDTTLTFEVTATDNVGDTATDTVDVLVAADLKALAGDDQTVEPNLVVTLTGQALGDSSTYTYAWTQTGGPAVTITDANAPTATFTAPLVEQNTTLTFQLEVTDDQSQVATDTTTVLVDVPFVRFSTTMGEFVILLRPDAAPLGVANFLQYVNENFYEGLTFHRVIPESDPDNDFAIVQGGGWFPDLSQTMRRDPIPIESDNGLANDRGTVAYARTADPNSATSEFFINVTDNPEFTYPNPDGYGYAVFGKIVEGMDVVDAISLVPTHSVEAPWPPNPTFDDVPVTPVIINEVRFE